MPNQAEPAAYVNPFDAVRGDTWTETTEEHYYEALEAVPPIYFRGGFAMGEAHSGGGTIYYAFSVVDGRYFARLLSLAEAPAAVAALRATIRKPLCKLDVSAVTKLAEKAAGGDADLRGAAHIPYLTWRKCVDDTLVKLLAHSGERLASSVDAEDIGRRASLYHQTGERVADAAAMLAIFESVKAQAPRSPREIATSFTEVRR